MIDHLCGDLIRKEAAYVVVRAGGVGFRVEVPSGAYAGVGVGEVVTIPTWLSLRQDGVSLFGFTSATEREFFSLLTTISGIGPKSALGILSHATPAQLAEAILREDVSMLTQVKGIGKKGARRIIVELAEKIKALKPETVRPAGDEGLFDAAALDEAREVLLSLGCSEDEADSALDQVKESVELEQEDAAERLVMEALKVMGPG